MPTYTYRCNDCGHEFDVRQRMVDDPLTECPECHGTLRRVVGSVGVVFKGSGFYVTDHRNGKGGGRVQTASNDKSSDGGTAKSNGTSGEGSKSDGAKSKSESKSSAE